MGSERTGASLTSLITEVCISEELHRLLYRSSSFLLWVTGADCWNGLLWRDERSWLRTSDLPLQVKNRMAKAQANRKWQINQNQIKKVWLKKIHESRLESLALCLLCLKWIVYLQLYLKKNLIKISGSGIRKHFTFAEGLPPAGGGDPSSLLPAPQWLATTVQRARSPFAALGT